MILQFDLVSQESADSSESLHELESFLRLVGDELQLRSELGVVGAEPLGKRLSLDHVVGDLGVGIAEELLVLFLSGCQNEHLGVSFDRMLEHKSVGFDVFEQHERLKCSQFQRLDRVLDSKHNQASVKGDLFEELADELLFCDELYVRKSLCCQCDSFVQAVFSSIGYINHLNDFTSQARIKIFSELEFEICISSQDNSLDIRHVICNEVSCRHLSNLCQIILSLLLSESGKTN